MIDALDIRDDLNLPELKVIQHTQFLDERGQLYSHFTAESEKKILRGAKFNHQKFAISHKDVLRGIHGDFKSHKLVSCIFGSIYQVVVDCRPRSSSFGVWSAFELSGDDCLSILIPPGFGNAYLTSSHQSVYSYQLAYDGEYLDAQDQFTYFWDDGRFNIKWPCQTPILSERDKNKPK